MKRVLLFFVYSCTILSAIGGPISSSKQPEGGPGPPIGGIEKVDDEHGDNSDYEQPTLLLTQYDDINFVENKNKSLHFDSVKSNDVIKVNEDDLINEANEKYILTMCLDILIINDYLLPNDIVVNIDKNKGSFHDEINLYETPQLDVTHDVFNAKNGLVHGIIYSGESIFFYFFLSFCIYIERTTVYNTLNIYNFWAYIK